jgi:hypothetical protein
VAPEQTGPKAVSFGKPIESHGVGEDQVRDLPGNSAARDQLLIPVSIAAPTLGYFFAYSF